MCASEVAVLADGGSSVEMDFAPDERVFGGQAVLCETWTSFRDDDWENPTTTTTTRWAVCIYRDPGDPERWITADVVAFEGVSSEGITEEEALKNVAEALRVALEDNADSLIRRQTYIVPPDGMIRYVQGDPS